MGVGFTRSFSPTGTLCPSVSPARGVQSGEGDSGQSWGLRGARVALARPGCRWHPPSRIFPVAIVTASPVPVHLHRPQGLPAPQGTSGAIHFFNFPPPHNGVDRAWGCRSAPNFRVAGAGILQQMLTHSGRTSWLLCREGLALGSGRWERSGAAARRGNAGVSGRLLHPSCSAGQPYGFSAFYFNCFIQCVCLYLFNLARSLSFLIGKENCLVWGFFPS